MNDAVLPDGPAGESPAGDIAVVGMAGRFPGAADPERLWEAIRNGSELISRPTDEEAREEGVGTELTSSPGYVPAAGVLGAVGLFDARFFGIGNREADLMDPQHRLLLECCWEALEDAGCVPDSFPGPIGVFAGTGASDYRLLDGGTRTPDLGGATDFVRLIANDRDFAVTRVAYRLNLRGPAMTVQTACSTSLVAVHLAARSLLSGECEAALAGGVSIRLPQRAGYLHEPGGILSPDGHCRPFSADAAGTVPGSGAGIVLLKRLEDARANLDHIYAVLKGSAVNNDGSDKLSYSAPGPAGQRAVITAAHTSAGVSPRTIGYVETHGTGTALGDPSELSALGSAFGTEPGNCPIGSVKANIGHLDVAAGVTGFIKAALALHHRTVPPALYCDPPNPDLDLKASPFRLPRTAEDWPASDHPRRAAVSSFGVGGTNAHAVLEEAPAPRPGRPARSPQLILLSARGPEALTRMTRTMADTARAVALPALAGTLLTGRAAFPHRWSGVAENGDEAAELLSRAEPAPAAPPEPPPVTFLLPGFGEQWAGMTREIYAYEPVFRRALDFCAETLLPGLGLDVRELLNSPPEESDEAAHEIRRTQVAMPVVFAVEYSLGRLLEHWGVRPDAMLGHSLGECVAACLAGVLSPADGLRLAMLRGRLVGGLPPGRMLSVPLPGAELAELLDGSLGLAAVVAPDRSVASGTDDDIARLESRLRRRGVEHRPIPVDRAAHSPALDPILGGFRAAVADLRLSCPRVPFLSNVTGTWITDGQAVDPDYWVRQLRGTGRLVDAFATLAAAGPRLLLEIGPGRTLGGWAARNGVVGRGTRAFAGYGRARDRGSAYRRLLVSVGRLWEAGVAVDRNALDEDHRQPRLPLPTYPFERTQHWITDATADGTPTGRRTEPEAASSPAGTTEPDGPGDRGAPSVPDASDAPAGPGLEKALATLWGTTLGSPGTGPDDDFFDLGGDSLTAVQLAADIGRTVGHHVTPQDLLAAPTPRALSATIREKADDGAGEGDGRYRALTRLLGPERRKSPGPPLYLVHPIGGGALVYRPLAAALAESCPTHGFTARGFDGQGGAPRKDLCEMAAAYAEELLADRPEGEFWLGGSSFGGVVALEMARVLRLRGRRPALTVLLDSPWPGSVPADERTYEAQRETLRGTASEDVLATLVPLRLAHYAALCGHRPGAASYDGPVLYVRAGDPEPDESDPRSEEWRAVVPGIDMTTSPGGHESMLREPHVRSLAALLADRAPRTG
ncbi:type I polyketide synthase [Streptomyces sp. DT24]|uniref:type I polyketide synthase n=1 Tax=Streptomyces sp. DT24 TaxID=3416520 RepID=UPI003CF223A9